VDQVIDVSDHFPISVKIKWTKQQEGCPISPILFDVFIDGILEGTHESGVEIP
jgi:hypothetical protein